MARARNIKPDFFTDDNIIECSLPARVIFIGLWTLADCEGRLQDKPKQIQARILPVDNVDADELLNELQANNLIIRYVVDGNGFIEIPNFLKHQNPHVKEKKAGAKYPDQTGKIPCKPCASTRPAPDQHQTNPADSLIPDPDSLILNKPPIVPQGDGTGKSNGLSKIQSERFEEFNSLYPGKRRNKGKARAVWSRLKPTKELFAIIMDSLRKHIACEDWQNEQGQYIPGADVWLRGERWENEPDAKVVPKGQHAGDEELGF
jgi:hypothetical protein